MNPNSEWGVSHSEKDIDELWRDWRTSESLDIRNRIFEHYFPWCREVASILFKKYNHYLMDWHDFLSIISISTLKCIDAYDKEFGVPFEGYAYIRVKGSILNEIKNHTKHIKDCDLLLTSASTLETTIEFDTDSFITIVDFAVEMAFAKLLENGCYESNRPDFFYENEQTANILIDLVEKLDFQEKFVIKSHYFQQIQFKEISNIMGVSSARISQIHKHGLAFLRKIYEKNF